MGELLPMRIMGNHQHQHKSAQIAITEIRSLYYNATSHCMVMWTYSHKNTEYKANLVCGSRMHHHTHRTRVDERFGVESDPSARWEWPSFACVCVDPFNYMWMNIHIIIALCTHDISDWLCLNAGSVAIAYALLLRFIRNIMRGTTGWCGDRKVRSE